MEGTHTPSATGLPGLTPSNTPLSLNEASSYVFKTGTVPRAPWLPRSPGDHLSGVPPGSPGWTGHSQQQEWGLPQVRLLWTSFPSGEDFWDPSNSGALGLGTP